MLGTPTEKGHELKPMPPGLRKLAEVDLSCIYLKLAVTE